MGKFGKDALKAGRCTFSNHPLIDEQRQRRNHVFDFNARGSRGRARAQQVVDQLFGRDAHVDSRVRHQIVNARDVPNLQAIGFDQLRCFECRFADIHLGRGNQIEHRLAAPPWPGRLTGQT